MHEISPLQAPSITLTWHAEHEHSGGLLQREVHLSLHVPLRQHLGLNVWLCVLEAPCLSFVLGIDANVGAFGLLFA
jgi:hypothetical protein